MFQLKWDDNYTKTIDDIPYWKKEEDINQNIIDYIKETSLKVPLYNIFDEKYYCCNCLNVLDKNMVCHNCHTKFSCSNEKPDFDSRETCVLSHHNRKITFDNYTHLVDFLIFNIDNNNVYFYYISDELSYQELEACKYQAIHHFIINNSFLVTKEGLTDLDNNIFISYKELDYNRENFEKNYSLFYDDYFDNTTYGKLIFDKRPIYLYTDNINDLKNTIYKYTRIWETKDILDKELYHSIAELTIHPLYYPQFEYLVNYKLYNLALEVPHWFKEGHNFKEIFGIDKHYLPMMVNNNINSSELYLLRLAPSLDYSSIEYFASYLLFYQDEIIELIKDYKINLSKLKKYIEKHHNFNFYEYLDYLHMSRQIGLDLDNKNVLFPKDLERAHLELYSQIEVEEDPEINKKIADIANLLSVNKYEDDKYVIYPVSSIAELIDESKQQKNCVRIYYDRIASYQCQIYFMRKKQDLTKSFVTIEVRNNHVAQASTKYNKEPSKQALKIINKWEQTLIPFEVNEDL